MSYHILACTLLFITYLTCLLEICQLLLFRRTSNGKKKISKKLIFFSYTDEFWGDHDIIVKEGKKCMEGSEGLPVGIQVSTLPFQDEKCLGVMKVISDLIGLDHLPLKEPKK